MNRRAEGWTNRRMCEAYRAGDGITRIAHVAGVSRQRVEQIVKGRPASVKPVAVERKIAYAEKALPEWRAGLAMWKQSHLYRGHRVDAAWLAREDAELRELELALASWRREAQATP